MTDLEQLGRRAGGRAMKHYDNPIASLLNILDNYGRPTNRREIDAAFCCPTCARLALTTALHHGRIRSQGYGFGTEYMRTKERDDGKPQENTNTTTAA